jgi:hypothetical protein
MNVATCIVVMSYVGKDVQDTVAPWSGLAALGVSNSSVAAL